MHTLYVITGPTASGKTARALQLAQQWHVPIINADSRQLYKDLPIGTAAPTPEQRAQVPHYFVATHALSQSYNAGMFERDAMALIHQLITTSPPNNDLPFAILCGGSMLYIDAICYGLDDLPAASPDIRHSIMQAYKENGIEWLQAEVQRLDPDYWNEVDQCNPQRLIHCIEICRVSNVPYSQLRKRRSKEAPTPLGNGATQLSTPRPFRIVQEVIDRPRPELYERINERVLQMIQDGLIDEAHRAFCLTLGYNYQSLTEQQAFAALPNSLQTVGYKELLPYLLHRTSLDEAIALIQQHTRNYAKRQITWWRNRQ